MSLLKCSVCGSPVKTYGKQGAILHTRCPNCGADSAPMITADENNRLKKDTNYIEIIRRKPNIAKRAAGM